MRRQFLALLTGALVLALSVGVGLSVAAGAASGGQGKADEVIEQAHNLDSLAQQARSASVSAKAPRACCSQGKVKAGAKVAQDRARASYVELARENDRQDLRGHRRVREHRHASYLDAVSRRHGRRQRVTSTGRCTTRSRSRTARSTTRRCGRRTTTRPTTRTCTSTGWRSTTSRSRRAATRSTATSPSGCKVPFNEARYGTRLSAAASSATNTWFLIRDAHGVLGRRTSSRRARRSPQITDYLKTFDVWDRYDYRRRRQLRRAGRLHRPLPDRPRRRRRGGRRPRSRARTRSGAIAGTRSQRRPATAGVDGAACRSTRRPACGGVIVGSRSRATRRASGSATTRSSPRTAASACSRTSTATTSACRISTTRPATPAARELDRLLDAHVVAAPTSATAARTGSATTRPTWAPGRSSSSAGSKLRGGATRSPAAEVGAQARPGRERDTQAGAGALRRAARQAGAARARCTVRGLRASTSTRRRATTSTTR